MSCQYHTRGEKKISLETHHYSTMSTPYHQKELIKIVLMPLQNGSQQH